MVIITLSGNCTDSISTEAVALKLIVSFSSSSLSPRIVIFTQYISMPVKLGEMSRVCSWSSPIVKSELNNAVVLLLVVSPSAGSMTFSLPVGTIKDNSIPIIQEQNIYWAQWSRDKINMGGGGTIHKNCSEYCNGLSSRCTQYRIALNFRGPKLSRIAISE